MNTTYREKPHDKTDWTGLNGDWGLLSRGQRDLHPQAKLLLVHRHSSRRMCDQHVGRVTASVFRWSYLQNIWLCSHWAEHCVSFCQWLCSTRTDYTLGILSQFHVHGWRLQAHDHRQDRHLEQPLCSQKEAIA